MPTLIIDPKSGRSWTLAEVARPQGVLQRLMDAFSRAATAVIEAAVQAGTEVLREELTVFVEGTPPPPDATADRATTGPAKAPPRAFPECLAFLRGLIPEQEIRPESGFRFGRANYLAFVFVERGLVVLATKDPSAAIYIFRANDAWRETARKKRSILRKERPEDLLGVVTRHRGWESRVAEYIN